MALGLFTALVMVLAVNKYYYSLSYIFIYFYFLS